MLIKILSILAALVDLFMIFVATRPAQFRISRSAVISAPPATVFALVNDFHRWEGWSPWAKLDPNVKNTFEGPASGKGAVFAWAGNNQVGEGRMTITESRPSELVLIRLDFFKPFAAVNTTEFKFTPQAGGTMVSWTMSGENKFIGKLMSFVFNCDKMVGGQFGKGLAQMKSIAEGGAGRPA